MFTDMEVCRKPLYDLQTNYFLEAKQIKVYLTCQKVVLSFHTPWTTPKNNIFIKFNTFLPYLGTMF